MITSVTASALGAEIAAISYSVWMKSSNIDWMSVPVVTIVFILMTRQVLEDGTENQCTSCSPRDFYGNENIQRELQNSKLRRRKKLCLTMKISSNGQSDRREDKSNSDLGQHRQFFLWKRWIRLGVIANFLGGQSQFSSPTCQSHRSHIGHQNNRLGKPLYRKFFSHVEPASYPCPVRLCK